MTEHTPGPWVCHSGAVWKGGPDIYPNGQRGGIPIAVMDGTVPTERDANARLIAASPILLAALESCHNVIHEHLRKPGNDLEGFMKGAEDQARAAIARAKMEK